MAHGLDEQALLVMRWQWQPIPAVPLTDPLPPVHYRDDAAFFAVPTAGAAPVSLAAPTADLMATFRFSFPQLSRQTPDLRFYRLIQLFNTPLRSLSSRDAGRSNFVYWRGAHQTFNDDSRFAHFWFFRDGTDADDIVVEFTFDGGLVLYSARKSPAALQERYAEICRRLCL